jgi:pyruvate-formate lyase-activating enzyme
MEIANRTDWMFMDIKHMDSTAHRAETGVGNELILRNIEAVASSGWGGRLIIRVPIVGGFNDSTDNLCSTAAFVKKLNLKEVNLLPFHRLGHSKYEQLGLEFKYAHLASPSRQAMLSHQRIFEAAGLQCYIGSETPF